MAFNKKQFYINTPEGDAILTEVFQEENIITILIGEDNRIDLDIDSAFDLADSLLMMANETDETNE